jgi:RNA polymerase sigma-70 factor (ECF subfamily)
VTANSDQELKRSDTSRKQDTLEFNKRFETLFLLYFKPLCFFCQYKYGFDDEEAKDIVHSTFTRLFESKLNFISESSARSYLYKLASGICVDLLRRESVKNRYLAFRSQSNFEVSANESNLEFSQLQAQLVNAINELPPKMKEVFELSRVNGLKYSEIARLLGISTKTVETQMSRALDQLRKKLASYL